MNIKIEKNGKGKEYDHKGKLELEGGYFNGKRSEKVQEYYENDILNFKGKYLNGYKLTGKIYDEIGNLSKTLSKNHCKKISYYYNCNLEFVGEELNGLRNGKRKEYDYNGKFKFEGECFNG